MSDPLVGARIVVAVTAPRSAGFYAGQLAALRAAGADVTFISSPSEDVARLCAAEGVRHVGVEMARAPSPLADARALVALTRALARLRPDVVNAGTPKAGLLGMLAAAALRVPVRIHTLHGLRYEAAHGLPFHALRAAQAASCRAATHVVCVSASLRARAIETGLFAPSRGAVIGDGTVNGIDVARFAPSPRHRDAGAALRASLGIGGDARVVGYLGRLANDKGIPDLVRAWDQLDRPGAVLVCAGELDDTDPPDRDVLAALQRRADVRVVGHVDDVPGFLAALDVLAMPTLREGFPGAPLEAAAMERPVVATRVTGCVDAVVDGVTGTLVAPRAPAELARALRRYLDEPDLARRHGAAGRARVVERFDQRRVHALTLDFYRGVLTPR